VRACADFRCELGRWSRLRPGQALPA